MPPPEPDAELIARWRAGCPAAFETLVRGWETPVGRLLHRLTGSAAAADELCHDVFVKVYLRRDRYAHAGTFGAWVYAVAVNAARDHARRRTPPRPLGEYDPAARPETDPAAADETAAIVADALARLPLPLREVVVLRQYDGYTFPDMARLLGVPATTLKSRHAAAMTSLRIALTARGLTPEEAR